MSESGDFVKLNKVALVEPTVELNREWHNRIGFDSFLWLLIAEELMATCHILRIC